MYGFISTLHRWMEYLATRNAHVAHIWNVLETSVSIVFTNDIRNTCHSIRTISFQTSDLFLLQLLLEYSEIIQYLQKQKVIETGAFKTIY